VGPALVLGLAGVTDPSLSQWPVLLAALAAQLAFDAGASTLRTWLELGIRPGLQPELLGWVGLIDILLSPVGLLAAIAAEDAPYTTLLLLPLLGVVAVFAAERRARLSQALELSRAYRGTTLLLGDVLEADDEYTGVHSQGVVGLSVAVADEMGLSSAERRRVEFGALLHDVGKIAVPKHIINKPGPLTDDEWVVIKTHTIEGQRMLDRVGGLLSDVGRIVRSSHERWDGGGYPDGLAGKEIPLGATIVSCCDAFNAMTTDRPYRPARSLEEALAELDAGSGTQFNPAVVEVLTRVVGRLRAQNPERAEVPVPL
jgi:putative nucleotidyltransferase with HDIG domain